MRLSYEQILNVNPSVYTQFRPALTQLPKILNLTSDCVVGNGAGYNQDAIYGSFGEYIERYHFYNEVKSSKKALFSDLLKDNNYKKLIDMIGQIKQTRDDPDSHIFEWVAVRNILTNEDCFYPLVMISMAHAQSPDRKFIPFIDSCGQSSHITKEEAFKSSLNEFIERQALIGSWLSKKAKYKISIETHPLLGNMNYIVDMLNHFGELTAFDLGNQLPGYNLIIFYFSKSSKDCVKYSVGMASSGDPVDALIRAISELWQSYVFMYLNSDNPENLDPRYKYLNDLLQFNNLDTRNMIPFYHQKLVTFDTNQLLQFHKIQLKEQIIQLKTISEDIYAYESSTTFMGKKVYFCKMMSPDFYLHMGIKMPLNFINAYSKLLDIASKIDIISPIPFP